MPQAKSSKPPTKKQWAALCDRAAELGVKPWALATMSDRQIDALEDRAYEADEPARRDAAADRARADEAKRKADEAKAEAKRKAVDETMAKAKADEAKRKAADEAKRKAVDETKREADEAKAAAQADAVKG